MRELREGSMPLSEGGSPRQRGSDCKGLGPLQSEEASVTDRNGEGKKW